MQMNLLGNLPKLPALTAFTTDEEFPASGSHLLLLDAQPSSSSSAGHAPAFSYPGSGVVHSIESVVKGATALEKFLADPNLGLRLITGILGLLLIAAALFSHPAVREKVVAAGKAAGEVAALA